MGLTIRRLPDSQAVYMRRRAVRPLPGQRSGEMAGKRKKKISKRRKRVFFARAMFSILVLFLLALVAFAGYRIFSNINLDLAKDTGTERTTIRLTGGSGIEEILIEPFDESLYDVSGLEKMVRDTTASFGNDMEFKDLTVEDGNAKITFSFKNADTLSAYHRVVFNAGTIDSLKEVGVQIPEDALKAGGNHAVVLGDALDAAGPKISAEVDIVVPKKIRFSSGSVSVDGKNAKKATVNTEGGSTALIVY